MTAIAAVRSHPRVVIPVAILFVVATVAVLNTKPAGPAIPGMTTTPFSVENIQRAMDINALQAALVYDFF
jgi:hypothetical protein